MLSFAAPTAMTRFLALGLLLLVACGDDDGSTMDDGGTTPPMDAAPVDAARVDGGSEEEVDGGTTPSGEPTWVAVGNWGYRAATTDGVEWTVTQGEQQASDHTPDLLRGVGYGNGWFVAVGGDRNSMVMRSRDGVSWEEDLHPEGGQWKGGVAYGAGVWVAVGGVGTMILSNDDAATWEPVDTRLGGAGRAITFGGGRFVAVGDGGVIATSTDGLEWTEVDTDAGGLGSVGFGHGLYVATGSSWNGSGFDTWCYQSPDASDWSDCPFDSARYRSVFFTGGRLIVSTDEGYEHTSDGESWTHSDASIPSIAFEAEGDWVGVDGDRRYSGTDLESLTRGDNAERGARGFAFGTP